MTKIIVLSGNPRPGSRTSVLAVAVGQGADVAPGLPVIEADRPETEAIAAEYAASFSDSTAL